MFAGSVSSSYSPFFMSGFKYPDGPSTLPSSAYPSFPIDEDDWFIPDFRRRGSLPTDDAVSVEKQLSVKKPKSKKERNWLGLDLARLRTRALPSPKPVPAGCLPAPPSVPEPPSPTPSSVLMPLSPAFPSNYSFPSNVSTPKSPLVFSFPPPSPKAPVQASLLPPTPHKRELPVAMPLVDVGRDRASSNATRSTVSTRYRRARRTDALAHVEGKGAVQQTRTRGGSILSNFMSMTDDEDEPDVFFDHSFSFGSAGKSNSLPDFPVSPTDTFFSVGPPSLASYKFPTESSVSRHPKETRRRSRTLSILAGLPAFEHGHRSFIEISGF